MEDRTVDAHARPPQTAGRIRVRQQILRQRRMKVEDRVAVETDILRGIDEKLDGALVVEDHLRVAPLLPLRDLAGLDQPPGVEQRVGVALEAARVPRKVDQQPVEYPLGVGARGLFADACATGFPELRPFVLRQVEAVIGPVREQELRVVADRLAGRHRAPYIFQDFRARPGKRLSLCFRLLRNGSHERPLRLRQDKKVRRLRQHQRRSPVARPSARTLHDEASAVDKRLEAVLQGAARRRGLQRPGDFLHGHAFMAAPHDPLNRL